MGIIFSYFTFLKKEFTIKIRLIFGFYSILQNGNSHINRDFLKGYFLNENVLSREKLTYFNYYHFTLFRFHVHRAPNILVPPPALTSLFTWSSTWWWWWLGYSPGSGSGQRRLFRPGSISSGEFTYPILYIIMLLNILYISVG